MCCECVMGGIVRGAARGFEDSSEEDNDGCSRFLAADTCLNMNQRKIFLAVLLSLSHHTCIQQDCQPHFLALIARYLCKHNTTTRLLELLCLSCCTYASIHK